MNNVVDNEFFQWHRPSTPREHKKKIGIWICNLQFPFGVFWIYKQIVPSRRLQFSAENTIHTQSCHRPPNRFPKQNANDKWHSIVEHIDHSSPHLHQIIRWHFAIWSIKIERRKQKTFILFSSVVIHVNEILVESRRITVSMF